MRLHPVPRYAIVQPNNISRGGDMDTLANLGTFLGGLGLLLLSFGVFWRVSLIVEKEKKEEKKEQ